MSTFQYERINANTGGIPAGTMPKCTTDGNGQLIQHVNVDSGNITISSSDFPATYPATQSGTWIPNDYYLEAAAGSVTGASTLNKFGKNPDVDTGTAEDIWGAGGTWTPPTQARLHDITSTSSDDTSAGTGARTVSILGLDGSYAEVSETVTLNGTVAAPTANQYVIIFRMIVTGAGSGGVNAGDIKATAQTDGTLTAQIDTGYNQTLMAIWQVPAGKTLYLNSYYASVNNTNVAASIDVRLWAKPFGQTWQTKHVLGLSTVGNSYFRHVFNPPLKLTEKTLIRLQAADATSNNMDISAGFDGVYR